MIVMVTIVIMIANAMMIGIRTGNTCRYCVVAIGVGIAVPIVGGLYKQLSPEEGCGREQVPHQSP